MKPLVAALTIAAIVGAFALGQMSAQSADAGPSVSSVSKQVKKVDGRLSYQNTRLTYVIRELSYTRKQLALTCERLKDGYGLCPSGSFTPDPTD